MKQKIVPFLLPLTLFLFLLFGPVLRDGMFIDGLAYVNIAKNMSLDIGSIWSPSLNGNGSVFYGHPPMVFWIESLFFDIFGNTKRTEDIYNISVFTGTIIMFISLWRVLLEKNLYGFVFFPILLFLSSQEVQLRYASNMLECTMSFFTLLGSYVFIRNVDKTPILASTACGIAAFLAFLCKGPAGLFPLAIPFLYGLVHRKASLITAVLPFVVLTLSFLLLFSISPSSLNFIAKYFDLQIVAALQGKSIENISDSRFDIIFGLLQTNIPAILIAAAFYLFFRRTINDFLNTSVALKKKSVFFFLVGLSAILPIVLSPKQANYYQLPSLPFFFIAISILLSGAYEKLLYRLTKKSFINVAIKSTLYLAVLIGLGTSIGKINTIDRRNREDIPTAIEIAKRLNKIPEFSGVELIVEGSKPQIKDSYLYPVAAYLNRYFNIFVVEKSSVALCIDNDGQGCLKNEKDSTYEVLYFNDRYSVTLRGGLKVH